MQMDEVQVDEGTFVSRVLPCFPDTKLEEWRCDGMLNIKHVLAVVHPAATGYQAIFGPGARVSPGACVGRGTCVGADAIIVGCVAERAYIGARAVVAEHADVGADVYIGDDVRIEDGVYVAPGAIVYPGVAVTRNVAYREIVRNGDRRVDGVPTVPRIHVAIRDAVAAHGIMMDRWHCGTVHCRAGWAIHLADAYALERRFGSRVAGGLVYAESDTQLSRVPAFYADNLEAESDISACARAQEAQGERAS
jgi:NDP-sugar pyrophosphorylase family protein